MKVADTKKQVKRHIKRSIAANKFAILSVQGVPQHAGGNGLNYSYTVGLDRLGLPELFICGVIDNRILGMMLKNQAQAWIKEGKAEEVVRTDIVKRSDGDPTPMRSGMHPVNVGHMLFNYCAELKQRSSTNLRIWQMLYPDPANLLPGEEGYDTRYVQPRLAPAVSQ
ncbi:DUF4262 domain-containing protein [Streptomyces sp. CHB9.2]|uniref:DUF4262 domain-containing protein n=1 Tax=Streptomyces sp. CHB9.2 TaxID=2841670 RepID=UPI0020952F49|nr:DUF4262 domain-containing protein [Streptomyces sp. CHB9.2]MCO6704747.1 DUF4262 domain-containing protein [Streptomyces sp. CHB9.2]